MADETIEKIILKFDTPGGQVDGAFALANKIFEAREKKEIISFVNTLAASAGYLLASSASKVILSSETDKVGSIGVVTQHFDISKLEERIGVKTTEITAGKFKRIASIYEPLSEEGKAELQANVDYLYGIFIDAVARNRGFSSDFVKETIAEGKIFTGKQGIPNLANEISTMDSLISKQSFGGQDLPDKEKTTLTADSLKSEHAVVYQEVLQLGIDTGVKQERERIAAINTLPTAGYESIIKAGIEGGETKADVAVKILEEQQRRGPAADLEKIKADAQSVDVGVLATDEETQKKKEEKARQDRMAEAANKVIMED
jgi:signal peptide peptidase SppA